MAAADAPGRLGRPLTARVVEVESPAERSRLCEHVLRDLPDWFGIEEATAGCISGVAGLPTFAVGEDAILALKLRTSRAAEVHVMGMRRARHGQEGNPCLPMVERLRCR